MHAGAATALVSIITFPRPAASDARRCSVAAEFSLGHSPRIAIAETPSQETIDRMVSIIEAQDWHLFARIDHAAQARKKGLKLRSTELILFSNPEMGTLLMQDRQLAAIELPMKALAWKDAEGQVRIDHNSIEWLKQRHGLTDEATLIDAVRVALGNTGSKSTIHRYLKEIEADEHAGVGGKVAASDALQDLVGRLAAQLHEEAETLIAEAKQRSDAALRERAATIERQQREITALSTQLQRTEVSLQTEQAAHAETQQQVTDRTLSCAQLEERVQGLTAQLAERETHVQSLETKHQHARDALELYRNSAKEQREQDQPARAPSSGASGGAPPSQRKPRGEESRSADAQSRQCPDARPEWAAGQGRPASSCVTTSSGCRPK